MADIQPVSESTTPTPVVVAVAVTCTDFSANAQRGGGVVLGGGEGADNGAVERKKDVEDQAVKEAEQDTLVREERTVTNPRLGLENTDLVKETEDTSNVKSAPMTDSTPQGDNATAGQSPSISQTGSTNQSQSQSQTTWAAPAPHHPPLKRFTSVNITKRFLEKTPSSSGSSLAGGGSSGHHATGSTTTSAPRRGISPSSQPAHVDRPASVSSRLITAKLTAVPQPSSGSPAGWLKPGQASASSATPTPPSSSPQPAQETSASSSLPSAGKPRSRPGESINGTTTPPPSASAVASQQASGKPVWRRVPAAPLARSAGVRDNSADFPTAAEAVHGRKLQISKAQAEAEAAAAQKVAALNETAAAFRGAHLDANVRHWDEMEDEDSDFLNGVIEFGDGRQYKVEQRRDSEDERPKSPPPEPETQVHVTKEERFGKDIGRDWPKRRSSMHQPQPGLPQRPAVTLQLPSHRPADGPSSASAQSPHDSISPTSRVLFNERSNRLEPWNSAKLPRHQGPPPPSGRDGHAGSGGVQLLQKGTSESAWKSGPPKGFGDRGRRWDRGPPSAKDEERPWELQRRESVSSVAASSVRERSRVGEGRRDDSDRYRNRRDSNAGLPPVPALPSSLSRENRPQSSHFRMPPPPVPPIRGPSSQDFPPGPGRPPTSPSASIRSARSLTSEHAPLPPPTVPMDVVDKDALVKDAMQLALERARKRKQEGEEEEKRRAEGAERAHKKAEAIAAALEKKKNAEEQTFLEEKGAKEEEERRSAVETVMQVALEEKKKEGEPMFIIQKTKDDPQKQQSHLLNQESPLKGESSGARPPLSTELLPKKPPVDGSPATQAESWRSKVASLPLPPPARSVSFAQKPTPSVLVRPKPLTTEPPVPQSLAPQVGQQPELDLSVKPDEVVEVVDFSDMEKLVGPKETFSDAVRLNDVPPRSQRPVASDFFHESAESSRIEPLSWRRPPLKAVAVVDELGTQTVPIFNGEEPSQLTKSSVTINEAGPLSPTTSSRRFIPHVDPTTSAASSVIGARSRVMGQYKEAPMSALTDTMSRIKGALDGMQSQDSANVGLNAHVSEARQSPVVSPKSLADSSNSWRTPRDIKFETPFPKAPPRIVLPPVQPEPFAITRAPPPPSPKPVWNVFQIRIPKVSFHREPLTKRQLHIWNLPHPGVRWDILSWDPPVEGMSKRELSRDEIFHKKNSMKINGKFRVSLPSRRIERSTIRNDMQSVSQSGQQTAIITPAGVKVKLPSVSSRQSAISSSDVPLWRKSAMPLTPSRHKTNVTSGALDDELNTTSRSPPPDPSTPTHPLHQKKENVSVSTPERSATVSLPVSETKSSNDKWPGGRAERMAKDDSAMDTINFSPHRTVNGELEGPKSRDFTPSRSQVISDTLQNGSTFSSSRDQPAISRFVPSRTSEGKGNHDHLGGSNTGSNTDTTTMGHLTPTWGKAGLAFSVKDSPSRSAPDPEHLKAVWSQSVGPSGNTSNSLRGITDELPSIPFNVQDMKSEDGETPPPTAPAPTTTRLSLQEVTRAFQQVPDSPAASSSRPSNYGPTPFASHIHRPNQPVAITLPPGQHMRPTYAPYPHIIGHSPSPTLMYASPAMHHRMSVNGPSPSIPHGMWLPTSQPASSQPGHFIRPGGASGAPTMMYPGPAMAPGQSAQMMARRMSVVSPPNGPTTTTPGIYGPVPMDMHARSPHAPPMGIPMAPMPIGPMFSPQPGQTHVYAVPIGAGRGGVVPRHGYEAYPMPHNGYQAVPNPSFMFQS